jgi:FkbM family methyltransferase
MRVFLDIGSHEGQTLDVVVRPEHAFDVIYAFEPMPAQYETLRERFEDFPAVRLRNYGLGDETATLPLYGSNMDMEASMYPAKNDVDSSVVTHCDFLEASEFFASYLTQDMTVIVKLNCEGAEVEILRNLMDTGEIWKCSDIVVDFDVRKIPGMEASEATIMRDLRSVGFTRIIEREYVMLGETHAERITHWLGICR